MTDEWPRNIVPYTEKKLRALSTPAEIILIERAPFRESELSAEDRALSHRLEEAGLLRREGDRLFATHPHHRDAPTGTKGRLEHKVAVVQTARSLIDEVGTALDVHGVESTAAMGAVPLPATPEAIARAIAILAETEDQLRALREEMAPHPEGRELCVLVFAGSRPHAFSKTPQ